MHGAVTTSEGREFQILIVSENKDFWYMRVLAYGTRKVMVFPLGEMIGTRIYSGMDGQSVGIPLGTS